jgi:hypothetical protein
MSRRSRLGEEEMRYLILSLALVGFTGCGVTCVYDLRKVATTPWPMFGIVERCEREVCRQPTRLPDSATVTGVCQ